MTRGTLWLVFCAVVAAGMVGGSVAAVNTGRGENARGLLTGATGCLLLVGVPLAVYFAPTGVAFLRGHPNAAPVAAVNLFLGWTLVGWVVALAWALTAFDDRRR